MLYLIAHLQLNLSVCCVLVEHVVSERPVGTQQTPTVLHKAIALFVS